MTHFPLETDCWDKWNDRHFVKSQPYGIKGNYVRKLAQDGKQNILIYLPYCPKFHEMTKWKRKVKKHGRYIQKFNTDPRGVSEGEKRKDDREKTIRRKKKCFPQLKKGVSLQFKRFNECQWGWVKKPHICLDTLL